MFLNNFKLETVNVYMILGLSENNILIHIIIIVIVILIKNAYRKLMRLFLFIYLLITKLERNKQTCLLHFAKRNFISLKL